MLQAEGVLGKCSMVTENTAPTSGQRWANGVPWEDLHRWMTVLIGPTAPVTLSSTRGLGEPLPAPGPMGHPSHSGVKLESPPKQLTSVVLGSKEKISEPLLTKQISWEDKAIALGKPGVFPGAGFIDKQELLKKYKPMPLHVLDIVLEAQEPDLETPYLSHILRKTIEAQKLQGKPLGAKWQWILQRHPSLKKQSEVQLPLSKILPREVP